MAAAAVPLCAPAQESKPTIRHHRVEETVPDDTSSPEVEQAEAAMQKNDFAAAESLLLKAVAAKPGDYRAWFDLGDVYNAANRLPEATEAYRKAVAAQADIFESNVNLGILLARQGKNEEAAKFLKAATQLKPGGANPEQSMAHAWLALGRVEESASPQEALDAYAQATKFNPKDPAPPLAAATLLEKQGQLDEAAREYQTALRLDTKSQPAISGLVSVYIRQNKYPQAETALRRLLAIDPANGGVRQQLGQVLAKEGKSDEAAEELKKVLQAGGSGRIELELGLLYVDAGNNVEAERWLRMAVQSLPQDAEAHYALGSLLMHVKRYPESQQELLKAVQLKPDLTEAYGNLAVVAAENKDYPLTLKALDYRAKFLPEDSASYFLRATTYDHLKAIPQAVEYYKRFIAADAGKFPDQEWQARHRLIALDPKHANKYESRK